MTCPAPQKKTKPAPAAFSAATPAPVPTPAPTRTRHASLRKPARAPYNRKEQLPRLIGFWPHEVEDCSEAATERAVALLRKALRSERQRGIGGHWTYDINRHLSLIEALREERERLRILKGLSAARALPPMPPIRGEQRQRAEILHLPLGGARTKEER